MGRTRVIGTKTDLHITINVQRLGGNTRCSANARRLHPSDKPMDLFKVKAKYKGKPEHEGPLFAYRALVRTRRREGLYAMPSAAGVSGSA